MGIIRIKQRETETDAYNAAVIEQSVEKTPEIEVEKIVSKKKKQSKNMAKVMFEKKNVRKTSKLYQKSDGKLKEEFYMQAVNFFDKEKNEYREIDNTLEERQDKGQPAYYQNRANDFKVKLSKVKSADKHMEIEKDGCRITFTFMGDNPIAKGSDNAVLQSGENQDDAFGRTMTINQELIYEEILPDTDLKFSVKGDRVKDYIVIKSKKEVYEYTYRMKLENLRMQIADGADALEFISLTNGETVFYMPAPIMEDAENRLGNEVYFEIDETAENDYVLQVKADENWINDKNTVFPVSIDPEIVIESQSAALSRYGWYNRTLSTLNGGYSYIGYYSGGVWGSSSSTEAKPYERQYYKFALDTFIKNSVIKKVELVIQLAGSSSSTPYYVAVGKTSLGLTHSSSYICDPSDSQVTDYVKVGTGTAYYRLDITSIIRQAISENKAYANFYLKGLYEETNNPNLRLYSSKMEVTYEQGCKSETIGTTEQQDVGRAGVGSVNLYTGALNFKHQDVAWNGNLMPVSIEHIFDGLRSGTHYTNSGTQVITANYSNMLIGHGWKLNLQQSLVSITPSAFGLGAEYQYVYSDENGLSHFFVQKDSTDGTTQYVDENDEMLKYDPTERILTKDGLRYQFNANGYLIKITNEFGVKQEISYDNANRIISVTDNVNRAFVFSYNSNRLATITLPSNQTISYEYQNEKLIRITYPNSHSVRFEYSGDNLTKAVNCNGTVDGYGAMYEYASSYPMVKGIVYNGIETEISYQSKLMTVLSKNDGEYTTNEAYEFDGEGNFKGNYTIQETDSVLPVDTENLLRNRNFNNNFQNWTTYGEMIYVGNSYPLYGKTLRIFGCGCSENAKVEQSLQLPAGTYTFSAYVRRSGSLYDDCCCTNAYIELESNGRFDRSRTVVNTNEEYQRLYCTITTSATQWVTVRLVNSGEQYAYFSGLQLQRGEAVTSYNYLENSNFEKGTEAWALSSDYAITSAEYLQGTKSLQLIGKLGEKSSATQTLGCYSPKTTRETFEISGWAKAYSPVEREEDDASEEAEAKFALQVRICYTDNTWEDFYAEFAKNNEDWQYVSLTFAKKQYKDMKSMQVSCVLNNGIGEAYFDNLQLICTNIEKDLTASDYVEEEEDTQEENGGTTSESGSATEEETQEQKGLDSFGNPLYSISYVEGKEGAMYQTYGYSADGNHTLYETDHRNNQTTYTYDENTSLVQTMTAPCRSQVNYTYDEMNQLKSMQTNVDGVSVGVEYTYDYLGNTSAITQNGFSYAITYTQNNEVQSIGVNGQTPLVSYTYTGGGNVKTATYANGDTMTCNYDRFGNMLSENWTSGNDTSEITYSYDGDGNVVKTLDKTNGLLYTYKYENGTLLQTEEYQVTLSGETVTKKTLLHRTELHYRDGKIGQKVEVYAKNGVETSQTYKYNYSTEEENFTLTLPTGATAVLGTDHFGRKTFDEIQLLTGFLKKQYTYVAGAYDGKLNGNLTSTPETELVEKIAFYGGKELRYTYNEAGDITQVRNENGALLEAYTYDGLGRLKTEQNVAGSFYKVYTYDAGGNLQMKQTYTCTTSSVVTSTNGLSPSQEVTYAYDGTWKDKLTAYNGNTYTYDANGNPANWKGLGATWEKGRQLKQLGTTAYKYNASGIRISKTVNGVEHRYTVEGIKILREEYGEHVLDFLYGVDGEAVGFTDNGTAYYYRKNSQGDVIGIFDKNGAELVTYTYDAWGKVLSVVGNVAVGNLNPIRYRGYYYDTDTELYYLNSRYYDPEVCRFINADNPNALCEFKELHYSNIYCYCENNPLISKDLDGQISLFSLVKFFKKRGSFVYQLFKVLVNYGIKMLKVLWSSFVQPGKINIKPLETIIDVVINIFAPALTALKCVTYKAVTKKLLEIALKNAGKSISKFLLKLGMSIAINGLIAFVLDNFIFKNIHRILTVGGLICLFLDCIDGNADYWLDYDKIVKKLKMS